MAKHKQTEMKELHRSIRETPFGINETIVGEGEGNDNVSEYTSLKPPRRQRAKLALAVALFIASACWQFTLAVCASIVCEAVV